MMRHEDNAQYNTLSMLRLLSSRPQDQKDARKPSKHCLVGTHWKALAECFQMSTHLPGFQWFLHHFILGQISHQQHKGEQEEKEIRSDHYQGLKLAGAWRFPSNSPTAPSNFSREPKDVLFDIRNTFMKLKPMQMGSLEKNTLFRALVINTVTTTRKTRLTRWHTRK